MQLLLWLCPRVISLPLQTSVLNINSSPNSVLQYHSKCARILQIGQNPQKILYQISLTDILNSSTRVKILVIERTCQGAKQQCVAKKAYSIFQEKKIITFLHMIYFRKVSSTEDFTQNENLFKICTQSITGKMWNLKQGLFF